MNRNEILTRMEQIRNSFIDQVNLSKINAANTMSMDRLIEHKSVAHTYEKVINQLNPLINQIRSEIFEAKKTTLKRRNKKK